LNDPMEGKLNELQDMIKTTESDVTKLNRKIKELEDGHQSGNQNSLVLVIDE